MLMVIFGAGASYDSCSTYPPGAQMRSGDPFDKFQRPPLANELFDDRPAFNYALHAFPQFKAIVGRLRAAALVREQTPVEAVLAEVATESDTYNRARIELVAIRCYLQRIIRESGFNWLDGARTGGITNQLALLREIELNHKNEESVCLVTFNYDLLLEHGLEELGHPVVSLEDYIGGPGFFKLFKLHGSVDWGRELPISVLQDVDLKDASSVLTYLINHGVEPKETDGFVKCNPNKMGLLNGAPLLPAIAIPIENKNSFECPKHILQRLEFALPEVTKILIIGWQAREAHFLNMLRSRMQQLRHVMVVDRNRGSAKPILDHFLEAIGKKYQPSVSQSLAEEGFSQLIRTNGVREFLER